MIDVSRGANRDAARGGCCSLPSAHAQTASADRSAVSRGRGRGGRPGANGNGGRGGCGALAAAGARASGGGRLRAALREVSRRRQKGGGEGGDSRGPPAARVSGARRLSVPAEPGGTAGEREGHGAAKEAAGECGSGEGDRAVGTGGAGGAGAARRGGVRFRFPPPPPLRPRWRSCWEACGPEPRLPPAQRPCPVRQPLRERRSPRRSRGRLQAELRRGCGRAGWRGERGAAPAGARGEPRRVPCPAGAAFAPRLSLCAFLFGRVCFLVFFWRDSRETRHERSPGAAAAGLSGAVLWAKRGTAPGRPNAVPRRASVLPPCGETRVLQRPARRGAETPIEPRGFAVGSVRAGVRPPPTGVRSPLVCKRHPSLGASLNV
ncbi:collagen alpha-2(I) chain-like isoform X1 [Columba livia]|uniref:collagen alpha-2(I) chain-like isoform X1 n=1 Tax=Columba livia TaxID=8932 RepID=UPI0031BA7071